MRLPFRPALGTPVLVAAVLGGAIVLNPLPAATSTSAVLVSSSYEPTAPYLVEPGHRVRRESWISPVRHYRLTARFGSAGGYWSGVHTGLDFAAPVGTPIRSIADGVVVSAASDGAYGTKTVVRLQDGTEVWYCHQDTQDVVAGDRVSRGQVIGAVGATGNVTGPHLHLEIRPGGGDPVDPALALEGHRVEP